MTTTKNATAPRVYVTLCASGLIHYDEDGARIGTVPGPSLAGLDQETGCGPHRERVYEPTKYHKHRTAEHGPALPKGW